MLGLMMDRPLLISSIIDHAALYHGDTEIVSRTIELENVAVGHPEVAEACVIGIAHPKWDERPVLFIVRTDGSTLDKDGVLAFLEGKIAKWWTPDDVLFVDELPHTATGKLYKSVLREKYKDYVLPTA